MRFTLDLESYLRYVHIELLNKTTSCLDLDEAKSCKIYVTYTKDDSRYLTNRLENLVASMTF